MIPTAVLSGLRVPVSSVRLNKSTEKMFLLPDQVYGEERSRSSKLRVSSKPTLITSSEDHLHHGMGTPGSKKVGVFERELSSSGCDPDPDEEDMDGYGQVRTYFIIASLVTNSIICC